MKNFFGLLVLVTLISSCKNEVKDTKDVAVVKEEQTQEPTYSSYGKKIIADDALSADRMLEHYKNMKAGDTVNAKLKGTISEVCVKKGCWMKLDMGNNQVVRVTFKDYGFFMPTDANGEVIVNGKAFIKETSVADLKHYAEDSGDSPEEIAKITKPEITLSFEADGVLLKK